MPDSTIKTECPGCNKVTNASEVYRGRSIKCRGCGTPLRIGATIEESVEAGSDIRKHRYLHALGFSAVGAFLLSGASSFGEMIAIWAIIAGVFCLLVFLFSRV